MLISTRFHRRVFETAPKRGGLDMPARKSVGPNSKRGACESHALAPKIQPVVLYVVEAEARDLSCEVTPTSLGWR